MPERFLSGGEARFSDCFLIITYRYTADRKLTDIQEQTINNINRNVFNVPIIDREGPVKQLSNRFKERIQRHSAHSVILDLEQTPISNINTVINETQRYLVNTVNANFRGVILATVAGKEFGEIVVNIRFVECKFGFTYRFSTQSAWDREYIQDNIINLSIENPDIRKVVEIDPKRIMSDNFKINAQNELIIEFSTNEDRLTQDEIVAINNGIEGFVRRASVNQNYDIERGLLTVL